MNSCVATATLTFLALLSVAAGAPLKFGVFTPECFDKIFNNFDFFDSACLKFIISKLLGYAIISGAFILKVPQILKLLSSKSALGLEPSMFYAECVSFTASTSYNILSGNPFSTYGENLVILVQNFILIALIWRYAQQPPSAAHMAGVVLGLSGMWLVCLRALPPSVAPLLPLLSTASNTAGRIPQILSNFRAGHTGQLAFLTLFLNFAGCAARVFTTLQEVDDAVILYSYVIAVVLNGTLVAQVALYWSATNQHLAALQGPPVTADTATAAAPDDDGDNTTKSKKSKKQD